MLGRGGGLGAVLRALRDSGFELTVVVAAAEELTPGRGSRRDYSGVAVTEMRRSLEALTDDKVALARALRRPLTIDRLGRHPLGNFMIHSLAAAFDDLGAASSWLGAQLGVKGSVMPATIEPLKFSIEPATPAASGASGDAERLESVIEFSPEHPRVSTTVANAIKSARLVLIAPGSLLTSVLVSCAIPDIKAALHEAQGRVVWICNLESERDETANDQLAILLRQGVRVDAILYDLAAPLSVSRQELAAQRVEAIVRPLVGSSPARHDRRRLRVAVLELAGAGATSTPDA